MGVLMFQPATLQQQYAAAESDDLRILVVGAGVAGLTVAQLLRHHGRHPVLIDRARGVEALLAENKAGYMLAMMPMVDPVFDTLGLWADYLPRGVPLARYGLHAHHGKQIRNDSLADLLSPYGSYQGIARGELIESLASTGAPATLDTTVGALTEDHGHTTAVLLVGDQRVDLEFDLVIIADGIHSTTRRLVRAGRQVDVLDTGWGGWVVWAPPDADDDLGSELWGDGFFLGAYPVRDRLGVFLGGPNDRTRLGPAEFVARARRTLDTIPPRIESSLAAVETADVPYYWPLADGRASHWTDRHSVLLGDAAAGFLPTAGIGAAMAMESAWVLARDLRAATTDNLSRVLRDYEAAQRPRVETAQQTSRQLARWMFSTSGAVAVLRDVAMRAVSVKVALRSVERLLATSPASVPIS